MTMTEAKKNALPVFRFGVRDLGTLLGLIIICVVFASMTDVFLRAMLAARAANRYG